MSRYFLVFQSVLFTVPIIRVDSSPDVGSSVNSGASSRVDNDSNDDLNVSDVHFDTASDAILSYVNLAQVDSEGLLGALAEDPEATSHIEDKLAT